MDFVTFSKQGICVLALGNVEKRIIKNNYNEDIVIHSLEAYNFLKHDPTNCVFFDSCDLTNQIIHVQQEYRQKTTNIDDESFFEDIYKIRI